MSFDNVRNNFLIGYGLVVGLSGTGDSSDMSFTKISLAGVLERLGIKANNTGQIPNFTAKNVAAVIVTAILPASSRVGSQIDISIASMGDAKSLLGGHLLVTPLYGADGNVYAVAQGPVAASGISATAGNNRGGANATFVKGVPTDGRIVNGGIIEREINFELDNQNQITLSLRNPDFTTAHHVAEAINRFAQNNISHAKDHGTVVVKVPDEYQQRLVEFITNIEQLRVVTDQPAKVVIDDTNGIVAINKDARIDTIALTHGSITIKISSNDSKTNTSLIGYNPAGQGSNLTLLNQNATNSSASVEVREEKNKLVILEGGVTLQDLVNALNLLGTTPRDLIAIINAIKQAGALHADVVTM